MARSIFGDNISILIETTAPFMRFLPAISMDYLVAVFAHKLKVIKAERDLGVVDILRCQLFFVVDDVSQLRPALLAQPAINRPALGYVCLAYPAPCWGFVKPLCKLFHFVPFSWF